MPIPQPSPYVSIKEPKPHTVPYRFYIEAGINKNSLAQLIAENVEGKREIIMNRYISEGESIEGIWETIYVGPITFILNLNGSEYARQTVNP